MQILTTPRMEQLMDDLMSTGRYQNRTELLEVALETLVEGKSFDLIRAELDQVSQRLVTPELSALEDSAVEELAAEIRTLDTRP